MRLTCDHTLSGVHSDLSASSCKSTNKSPWTSYKSTYKSPWTSYKSTYKSPWTSYKSTYKSPMTKCCVVVFVF